MYLLLLIAIFPVYVLGLYINNKDYDREPPRLLAKIFVGGILSAVPAVCLELLFSFFMPPQNNMTNLELIVSVFVGVALIEEFCKFYVVYYKAYNHPAFNDFYDGIIYGVFSALGFACIENILYVFNYGVTTGLYRAVLSVPSHVCNGIVMGAMLSFAKEQGEFGNMFHEKWFLLYAVLVPTVEHGVFDYCLTLGRESSMKVFFVFLIFLYILSFSIVKYMSKNDRRIVENF